MKQSSRARIFPSAVLFVLVLVWAGCGETYRPIANPIPAPGGDPQATHYAIVVNDNEGQLTPVNPASGPVTIGPSATQIDVSGDTNIGNHPVGLNPVSAAISPGLGYVYVVNQGDNTLSEYVATAGVGATVATIPLKQTATEPNAGASYVAATASYAFVVESALNRVVVVNGNSQQVLAFVPVGVNPVSVVATSDSRKVYVANQGSNTVSVISTKDNSNQLNIPVGGSPGPIAISGDNNYVYVANQSDGTVSVIDTSSDTVTNTIAVGTNPSELVYDNNLERLYVVNTGSNSITIVDAHTFPQTVLTTVATSAAPVAVAPLDNGSKFYVLYLGNPGSVEVYDAQGYYKRATITVGNNALPNGLPAVNQTLLAAAPGSTKVYAVNYGGDAANPNGSTSVIRTLDDTVSVTIPAPQPHPVFVAAR